MKKKLIYAALLMMPFVFVACENTDEQAQISIDAKDGNINVNSSGLEKFTDSTIKGNANVNISKDGNVSVNGKNLGVNVDSTGVNVKMKDGKGITVDSEKVQVNIGGFKVNIQK